MSRRSLARPLIMSWAITINNLPEYEGFPEDIIERMLTVHILYPQDMNLALNAAKKAGLQSATLAGGRTPNPYSDDEVVNIMITGMAKAPDFNAEMKRIVVQPEFLSLDEEMEALEEYRRHKYE